MSYVFIVDDHYDAQHWLSEAVALVLPNAPVQCYDDLSSGLAGLAQAPPMLCLIDLVLPDGSGIECISRCRQWHAETPIIVVTLHADDDLLIAALAAGADAFLLKDESKDSIAAAISTVLNAQPFLSSSITRRLMRLAHSQATQPPPSCPLTAREQLVLQAMAKGYKTSEVAQLLSISPHTTAKHIKNIYLKLGIHNRAEAIAEALRYGVIDKDTLLRG